MPNWPAAVRAHTTGTVITMAGCRFCGAALRHTFVDLGMSPLCESFLTHEQLTNAECNLAHMK